MTPKLWVYAGVAGVFLIMAGWIAWLRHDVAGYREAATAYKQAQATNLETISKLEARERDLVAQNAVKEQDAKDTAARNKRMFDALNEELAKRQTKRETIYVHDAKAAEWSTTVVPAAVADSLR